MLMLCIGIIICEEISPFGLRKGMTVAELTKIDPKIEKNNEYTWTIKPSRPNDMFNNYLLKVSPETGLFQIIAMSGIIETNVYGHTLLNQYTTIKEILIEKYGKPDTDINQLSYESIWDEPRDFMMSLYKEERVIGAMIEYNDTIIGLRCIAVSTDAGYITLTYEFDNASDAIDKINKIKNSQF